VNKKISISKDLLEQYYRQEHKSTYSIAKIFDCNPVTISNRLKEFRIVKRSNSDARMKYRKYDFSGNLSEKAYLIGFRLGDLNVYQTNQNSELILVRCHTTQSVQVELIRDSFAKYGQVTVSKSRFGMQVNCYLNLSFVFILPKYKKVPVWIADNNETIASFIAGYTDAEGNFILNQNRARFKIDSYDNEILEWISNQLENQSIKTKFRLICKQNAISFQGYRWRENLWRLNINEARSLLQFILLIKPFLKHQKRYNDMLLSEDNIKKRISYGTVKP